MRDRRLAPRVQQACHLARHRQAGLLAWSGHPHEVLLSEAVIAPEVGAGCSLTGGVRWSYYDDTTVTSEACDRGAQLTATKLRLNLCDARSLLTHRLARAHSGAGTSGRGPAGTTAPPAERRRSGRAPTRGAPGPFAVGASGPRGRHWTEQTPHGGGRAGTPEVRCQGSRWPAQSPPWWSRQACAPVLPTPATRSGMPGQSGRKTASRVWAASMVTLTWALGLYWTPS